MIHPVATKKSQISSLRPGPRQFEVTALALHRLGGSQRAVDTEDVAIKSHEIAPTLFAWRKYPDQVNLELVRVSLSDAKKVKNGVLVSGSGRDGWRLTPDGVAWVLARGPDDIAQDDLAKLEPARRNAGSIDTVRRTREEQRIKGSIAWDIWKAEGRIDIDEVRKLFRIDSYTSAKLVDVKIARLLSLFPANSEVGKFIEAARRVSLSKGGSNA